MKVAIHQPNYLPYSGFFHKLSLVDTLVLMDNTQYDKKFTNRNKIIVPNGWIWISVPIKKEHKFSPNRIVEINNDIDWKTSHWKKIFHSYKNAPFFSIYEEFFKKIYEKNWDFLFDLDFEIITQIIDWLEIDIEIIRESELSIHSESTQKLIDISKKLDGHVYISGIGGKNYLKEELFEKSNLKLIYQNYSHPKYPQRMTENFIPDLSIIDMLFNIGPKSSKLIKGEISYD